MLPLDERGLVITKDVLMAAVGDKDAVDRILEALGDNALGRTAQTIKRKAKVPRDVAEKVFEEGCRVADYYYNYVENKGQIEEKMLRQLGILHRDNTVSGVEIKYINELCFFPQSNPLIELDAYYTLVAMLFYPMPATSILRRLVSKADFVQLYAAGGTATDLPVGADGALILKRATQLLKRTPLGAKVDSILMMGPQPAGGGGQRSI